jgi:hypothetical protein
MICLNRLLLEFIFELLEINNMRTVIKLKTRSSRLSMMICSSLSHLVEYASLAAPIYAGRAIDPYAYCEKFRSLTEAN